MDAAIFLVDECADNFTRRIKNDDALDGACIYVARLVDNDGAMGGTEH